jgi:phage FluMu gp28-like protein
MGAEGGLAHGVSYLGMDIGRHRDLTVLWVLTRVDGVCWTREVVVMEAAEYDDQEAELQRLMQMYGVRYACLDATTKGEMLAERAVKRWGEAMVRAVVVHHAAKRHLAPLVRVAMERGSVVIPQDEMIRADLHRVEKQCGEGGTVRYEAPSTEDGHSDRFFALALALEAAGEAEMAAPVRVARRQSQESPARAGTKRKQSRESRGKRSRVAARYGGF